MSSTDFIPLVSRSDNTERSFGWGKALVLNLLYALSLVGITTVVVLRSVPHDNRSPAPSLYDTAERVRVDELMDHFEEMKELMNDPSAPVSFPDDAKVVYMNNTEAFTDLTKLYPEGSALANDFFMMLQGFDTQINQAYCSVASTIAVLNSFKNQIPLPVNEVYKPHEFATQADMFNNCTAKSVIKHTPDFNGLLKPPGGLVLDQIAALIECNLANSGVRYEVETIHMDPSKHSWGGMVRTLCEALVDPNKRIIINYKRTAVNQAGGGHFSPIGAYSPERNAFLVMDVAKYKYANAWIDSRHLAISLSGEDSCGSWNYPEAQMNLPANASYKDNSSNTELWKDYYSILGCKPAHRGIIIVTVYPQEDEGTGTT